MGWMTATNVALSAQRTRLFCASAAIGSKFELNEFSGES
jgi:hypothetical protein